MGTLKKINKMTILKKMYHCSWKTFLLSNIKEQNNQNNKKWMNSANKVVPSKKYESLGSERKTTSENTEF